MSSAALGMIWLAFPIQYESRGDMGVSLCSSSVKKKCTFCCTLRGVPDAAQDYSGWLSLEVSCRYEMQHLNALLYALAWIWMPRSKEAFQYLIRCPCRAVRAAVPRRSVAVHASAEESRRNVSLVSARDCIKHEIELFEV